MSKWLGLIQALAPIIITTINPKLAPIAGNLSSSIQEAEQIAGAKGADKLAHVQNIALNAAQALNTAHGTQVVDITSLSAAVQEATDTVVAVTNLVNNKSTGNV